MNTRLYTKEDYETLKGFWSQYKDWETSPVPETVLPPYGCVVEVDNKIVSAGFLYETKGHGCSWMEWVVADPKANKELRDKSLDLLIDTINSHAKNEGYQFVFTCVMHPKLMERYERHGFMKGDSNMTNMIKRL